MPWLLLLCGLLIGPLTLHAESAPVVVAVDTSRSLNSGALAEVADRLRLVLASLDPATPTGLLAFDDTPRWIVEPGAQPSRVAEALGDLELQGNFTLLNDALFVATRELEAGGVLLLATDGRDENSAVEVTDIARRCEAQDVRIVAVGTGRSVAEKSLRRLALISNGAYLGPVDRVDASAVAEGVRVARAAVTAGVAPASSSRPADWEPADQAPDGASGKASDLSQNASAGSQAPGTGQIKGPGAVGDGQPTTEATDPWWMAPPVWALGALLVLTPFLLRRRRRRSSSSTVDEDEIREELLKAEALAADQAEAETIRLELAQAEALLQDEAPEVTVDTAVFQRMTLDERLDRTRVLSNHSVLIMRKLGEPPRTFMLDRAKAFAVGRDRVKNTLGVPDPALSAQHFKIVPRNDEYFFVDLESTNGSYVNGRNLNAKRLRHGDQIRAGQVEFEYQSYSNI